MSYYTELLNIEEDEISILSDAYFGYASSLLRKEDIDLYPYVASCFVVAGVLKSLIKPGDGSNSFNKASMYYRRLNNNYWLVCSICGNDVENLPLYFNSESTQSNYNFNLFEEILISPFLIEISRIFDEQTNISQPVGRLNIPIRLYLDALQSLNYQQSSQYFSTDPIVIFLKRASEYILFMKEDSFHWQNFKGDFLYIEPETLAFCIALCKKMANKSINPSEFIERIEIDPLSKFPLLLANDILNNIERH